MEEKLKRRQRNYLIRRFRKTAKLDLLTNGDAFEVLNILTRAIDRGKADLQEKELQSRIEEKQRKEKGK